MSKSFSDWLKEGESIYTEAFAEFESLETQLVELEQRLAAKKDEVNQIAGVIGKPPVEGKARQHAVQIVDSHSPGSIAASRNTIAKALSGRGLGNDVR